MAGLNFTLIIPAAGSASRMRMETAKPYLELEGKTILGHTLSRFARLPMLQEVIIATSEENLSRAVLLRNEIPNVRFEVVKGGSERQESVENALRKIHFRDGLVAIHDAARPFVSRKKIVRCLEVAAKTGSAILGVPARDTVKWVDDHRHILGTPDRQRVWLAQTPQIFRYELLEKAYRHAREEGISATDDSSLVELLGENVTVVAGNEENIKITYPVDLKLARLLFRTEAAGDE